MLLLIIEIMYVASALRTLSALCWFEHSWLMHVEVCAWEYALEVFMIELLYLLGSKDLGFMYLES